MKCVSMEDDHMDIPVPSDLSVLDINKGIWLNYEAEHAGINVSRVLQEALMNVLGVLKPY